MRFTRWDQKSETSESNQVLLLLAHWHMSQVNHPSDDFEVLMLALLEGDLKTLCLHEVSVNGNPEDYLHLRQVTAFFSKRQDLDIGIDKSQAAWETFLGSESKCRESNELFRKYAAGGFYFLPRVESVLYSAQRKIAYILGDVPSFQDFKFRFGPGATTQVKKRDASVRRKLAQRFCRGETAERFFRDLAAECPDWFGYTTDQAPLPPCDVSREVVEFVPKNAKTFRKITKAPTLDGFVQLGIGDHISDRLRMAGIDLRDQTRNQRLAREGSITGALATLDLSSASDLISCGFVESMLPFDWWDLLRSFRSREFVTKDGSVFKSECFASMGNGFTFPLETLLFYAIVQGCVHKEDLPKVAVYGDDIIVPVYAVPLLIECLTACGFAVNGKKSFWDGEFRESCGKDYYRGIDVRPCFVKEPLSGHTCFVLHNFYARAMQPEPAEIVRGFIDESLQIFGPDGYGDGHLLGDFTPSPLNRDLGWSGVTFETYTYKPRKRYYALGADYVYPSYSIYVKGDLNDDHLREALLGLSHIRSHGGFRPERSDSLYSRKAEGGRVFLSDTLPGIDGYKRIKIYTLNRWD